MRVKIYAASFITLSVCAPADMSIEDVLKDVEEQRPSGTEYGWHKSEDTHFASGHPNPCSCNRDASRQHWLLDC